MVGPDGALPLPWLEPLLRSTLRSRHAHALLLHGPNGVGQFELAMTLAQAWLCEVGQEDPRPCGHCASCRLVQAHSHPDLLVLVPEAMQVALGWGGSTDTDAAPERSGKAKPSKEIKVGALRAAINFAQTTSARGRRKVVVVHPAERMNAIAANALLKTLEEPPGDARFVLGCAAPDALLPTIRSRCQTVMLGLPPSGQAVEWLAQQGVADAAVMLAATGGQPQLALEWARDGVDAALWARVPGLVRDGESAAFAAWPMTRVVDALQKVCHDAICVACAGSARYFPGAAIPAGVDRFALLAWMRELNRAARHAEHPWITGLMTESLVLQGQRALARSAGTASVRRGISVHSGA